MHVKVITLAIWVHIWDMCTKLAKVQNLISGAYYITELNMNDHLLGKSYNGFSAN